MERLVFLVYDIVDNEVVTYRLSVSQTGMEATDDDDDSFTFSDYTCFIDHLSIQGHAPRSPALNHLMVEGIDDVNLGSGKIK